MNAENTAITETLLNVDAIVFFVWVLGVATAAIWKKVGIGHWVDLTVEMLGYFILATVIAFIVVHWFGFNGMRVLVFIFLSYHIVRIYLNIRHWFISKNKNGKWYTSY